MLIEVNTGLIGMISSAYFRVECFEKNCRKCYLRFRCYTTRDEKIEIGYDEWFKINKIIEHKVLIPATEAKR